MLDYSDEESEVQSMRRRRYSPPKAMNLGIKKRVMKEAMKKAESMFQNNQKGTSRVKMLDISPPVSEAFIISEFVSQKSLRSESELQIFEDNNKGDTSQVPCNFSLNHDDHPDSFYKSMRTLIISAQFFAVFPILGIRGPNYQSLAFKWIHYQTALWGLTFAGTLFCFFCTVLSGVENGAFQAASGIFYFACGTLSSVLMLNLSRNWRKVNEQFRQVEVRFRKYGYPKRIGFKFQIFTIIVLLVALVEHFLAKLKNFKAIVECSQEKDDFFSLAESFFLREYVEVFSLYTYSFWKGVLVFISHFLTTANWNIKDLFLCLISWTIAERFKQVHELLEKVHGKDRPVSFWKEVREDFNTLSVLTNRVDSSIRKLMLLSMGNNLFFICIQLFHSLRKKVDAFRLVYFFWSFGFLVLRTGFVAFSAARINDESKEPKIILYSVPQKNYTAEVRRFLTQLTTHEVALTGSGFFYITRSLILTITGSVLTYEIVLVQFGTNEIIDSQGNLTSCFQ